MKSWLQGKLAKKREGEKQGALKETSASAKSLAGKTGKKLALS